MDTDTLKKIKNVPLVYFPIYSWIYILEKTNNIIHFILVLFMLIFSHMFLKRIFNMVNLFNKEEKKFIQKEERKDIFTYMQKMGIVINRIKPAVKPMWFFNLCLVSYILLSLTAICLACPFS